MATGVAVEPVAIAVPTSYTIQIVEVALALQQLRLAKHATAKDRFMIPIAVGAGVRVQKERAQMVLVVSGAV